MIVADNLVNLLKKHYPEHEKITNKQKAFAKDYGLTFATVQRICNEQVGASLDTLELIAGAFDLAAYQLTIPGLDVGNPQIAKGAPAAEQRMYAKWRKVTTGVAPKPAARTRNSDTKGQPTTI